MLVHGARRESTPDACRHLVRKFMLSALLFVICSYSPIPYILFAPLHLDLDFKHLTYQCAFQKSLLTQRKQSNISMIAQVKGITFQNNCQNIFASFLCLIAFKRSYTVFPFNRLHLLKLSMCQNQENFICSV